MRKQKEVYREEKRKVKRSYKVCISEQKQCKWTVWKENVNGNSKLLRKEVSNVKGEMEESCSKIKDRNGKFAQGEDEGSGRSILRICII